MKVVDVCEAKAHLSEYLAAVEAGETVLTARRNKPVAKLVPAGEPASKGKRPIGLARGMGHVGAEFFEAIDDEFLDLSDGTKMLPSDPLDPGFDATWVPGKHGQSE
jgi:prevent-host-death family protein